MTRFESRKPKICKNSLKESIADTMLGLLVNFPCHGSWYISVYGLQQTVS